MAVQDTPTRASVLIVEADSGVSLSLTQAFVQEDFQVRTIAGEVTAELESYDYDILVIDSRTVQCGSFSLVHDVLEKHPNLVVLLTVPASDAGSFDPYRAEEAMDRLLLPFELSSAVAIARALQQRVSANRAAVRQATIQHERFQGLLKHFLSVLVQILSAKDQDTYERSGRVAELATALAARLCPLEANFPSQVRLAALFRDIGINCISDAVLHKKWKLDAAERALMQSHPAIGEQILSPVFINNEMLPMVRGHHERWDGTGYPDGHSEESIPLGARIVAVADAFVAMTSDRPYRAALSNERTLQILRDGMGVQWDPEVCQAFFALVEAGALKAINRRETHKVARDVVADAPRVERAPAPKSSDHMVRLPAMADVPVINLQGNSAPDQMDWVRDQVTQVLASGRKRFVVNLEHLVSLDARSVEDLFLIQQRVQGMGRQMLLRNASTQAKAAFQASGFMDSFTFDDPASDSGQKSAERWRKLGKSSS